MKKVIVLQPYKVVEEAALAKVPHGVENEVVIKGVAVDFVSGPEMEISAFQALLIFLGFGRLFRGSPLWKPTRQTAIRFCPITSVELISNNAGDGSFVKSDQAPVVEGCEELVKKLGDRNQFYGIVDVRAKVFPNGRFYVKLEETIFAQSEK